jgi:hypothetical protein
MTVVALTTATATLPGCSFNSSAAMGRKIGPEFVCWIAAKDAGSTTLAGDGFGGRPGVPMVPDALDQDRGPGEPGELGEEGDDG